MFNFIKSRVYLATASVDPNDLVIVKNLALLTSELVQLQGNVLWESADL